MTGHWGIEAVSLFALCHVLARVEIEIEGAHGWAVNLPTWRWGPAWWLKLTNGKPLTGYHLWLTLFLIGMFHLPLTWAGWSRELEAAAVSRYLLLTAFWDFQWFVWNPAWGPRRFFAEPVWWFSRRWLGLPADYFLAAAGSAAAQALIWPAGLGRWSAVFLALLAASAFSAMARTERATA